MPGSVSFVFKVYTLSQQMTVNVSLPERIVDNYYLIVFSVEPLTMHPIKTIMYFDNVLIHLQNKCLHFVKTRM